MNSANLESDIKNLHTTVANFTPVEFLSPIWQTNISYSIRNIIYNNMSFLDKLKEIHKCVHYSLINNKEVLKNQSLWWANYLRFSSINWNDIEESIFISDDFCTKIDGRRFSPDLGRRLSHYHYMNQFLSLDQEKRLVVLELGAGYGGFPRTFKEKNSNCTYIILDIPDTLVISYGYLKTCYPDSRIKLITNANDKLSQDDLNDWDFIFIPVGLDKVLHGLTIDLFINTHSLGEMPNRAIQHWMDLIQNKVNIRNAFMLNRFLNRTNPRETYRLVENMASCLFDYKWDIKYWEFEPPFMRCPFNETIEAQCLLLILSRNSTYTNTLEQRINLSRGHIEYVKQQDWFRFTQSYSQFSNVRDILTSYIYPERAQDFTINGTLFHLWEAIRLNPTKECVGLMIQYLKYINSLGTPFEEVTYYIDLFQRLSN